MVSASARAKPGGAHVSSECCNLQQPGSSLCTTALDSRQSIAGRRAYEHLRFEATAVHSPSLKSNSAKKCITILHETPASGHDPHKERTALPDASLESIISAHVSTASHDAACTTRYVEAPMARPSRDCDGLCELPHLCACMYAFLVS